MRQFRKLAPSLAYCLFTMLGIGRAADKVLLFTRTVVTPTSGYREDNIAPARLALKNFLEKKGLAVDTSESDALFTDAKLATYKTIIFLKTSGNILNEAQHSAFEKYFRGGGGFVGIHSALDTEMNWPFYGQIIGGAYYQSLGGNASTKETIVVEDTSDISTDFLPLRWSRTDEVYNFKANPRKSPTVHVLLTVDESTYPKGIAGTDHPMSWRNELLGGRAWITAMGHTTASYSDSLFLKHLWGGIQYAIGQPSTRLSRTRNTGHNYSLWTGRPNIRLTGEAPKGFILYSQGSSEIGMKNLLGRAVRSLEPAEIPRQPAP